MNILLLQLKRIGDLLLTTPAIAALRERFPEAHVTMVVSSESADLLPAISGVDRILMARRNLSDLAAFLAVAANKFDYCIDFTRNDRSAFLAFLSGARKRIVSYRVRDQSKSRARLYTDFVNVRMRDLHTIDYNLSLLEPLGIRDISSSLRLQLPQSAHEKADALRRDWNVGKPFVVLHPGSARREKLWEAARWAQLIERFNRDKDFDLILTSGASKHEQMHISAIKNETKNHRSLGENRFAYPGGIDWRGTAPCNGRFRPDAPRGRDPYAASNPVRANESFSLASEGKFRSHSAGRNARAGN